jgi:hypothetical protein
MPWSLIFSFWQPEGILHAGSIPKTIPVLLATDDLTQEHEQPGSMAYGVSPDMGFRMRSSTSRISLGTVRGVVGFGLIMRRGRGHRAKLPGLRTLKSSTHARCERGCSEWPEMFKERHPPPCQAHGLPLFPCAGCKECRPQRSWFRRR